MLGTEPERNQWQVPVSARRPRWVTHKHTHTHTHARTHLLLLPGDIAITHPLHNREAGGPLTRTSMCACASCRLDSSDRLAIQDGSTSESGAQSKWNPSAHLFSCYFHYKQELIKKGATGKADSVIYSECMKRSKRSKMAVEQRCESLSKSCPLSSC